MNEAERSLSLIKTGGDKMRVKAHMTGNPVTVTPEESLATANAKMQSGGFRQLPVVGDDGRLVGIVTNRDIREHRGKLRISMVKTAMTKNPVTVTFETTLKEVARKLLELKVGGLPVVTGAILVGIITTSDILRAFIERAGEES
ncbi:MAG: CBS domain-containing protein [Candidatus Binatia bacterium]